MDDGGDKLAAANVAQSSASCGFRAAQLGRGRWAGGRAVSGPKDIHRDLCCRANTLLPNRGTLDAARQSKIVLPESDLRFSGKDHPVSLFSMGISPYNNKR